MYSSFIVHINSKIIILNFCLGQVMLERTFSNKKRLKVLVSSFDKDFILKSTSRRQNHWNYFFFFNECKKFFHGHLKVWITYHFVLSTKWLPTFKIFSSLKSDDASVIIMSTNWGWTFCKDPGMLTDVFPMSIMTVKLPYCCYNNMRYEQLPIHSEQIPNSWRICAGRYGYVLQSKNQKKILSILLNTQTL